MSSARTIATAQDVVARFVGMNRRISRAFDRILPEDFNIDGNWHYANKIAPRYLQRDLRVYDLGAGSRPFLSPARKDHLSIWVKGLDISGEELRSAPAGSYDAMEVADLTAFEGDGSADLVICQSTLEHVRDGHGALRAIATSLRPGGKAVIFVPCRNAWFARLNMLLPENIKKAILFRIYPETNDGHHGFEAFYDNATPGRYRKMASELGLELEFERAYWRSAYFQFLFPLHAVWRIYQIAARRLAGDNMCESFAMVLTRPAET
jgi:2-polyprenyl-6-hydroxyphenyl methylase/3-demethylubiquinone-9 3-methyltransferase